MKRCSLFSHALLSECLSLYCMLVLWIGTVCAAASPIVERVRDETGGEPGLLIVLGCADSDEVLGLAKIDEHSLVQAWDTESAAVEQLRQQTQQAKLSGRLSAGVLRSNRLPYLDNLADGVIVQSACGISRQEVERVLQPGGFAIYLSPGGSIETVRKPLPAEMDDWQQYLHDASNNAVSHDTLVGPPQQMQWQGSPRYSRHHDRMSSVSAVVSAGGRVFYIIDEASPASALFPPKWTLVARDAFNGVVLWKRPLKNWMSHLWPLKSGPAQLPRRLIADGDRVYVTLAYDGPLLALDAATGDTVMTYGGSGATEEAILADGVLVALVNERLAAPPFADMAAIRNAYRGKFWDEAPRKLLALRASSGERLWERAQRVLPGTIAADGRHVVFHDGERIVCLDQSSGQQLWRSDPVPRADEILSFYIPILVLYDNVVLFSGGETAGKQTGSWYREGQDTMTALSLETGERLWTAYHPPSGYRSPEDLLVVDGLVWTGETTSGRAEGLFTGRDPRTGAVKREFLPDVDTYWFHHRCYRSKATDNYLLVSRAGVEFLDVRKKTWKIHHWVRGACLYGVMPANGLLYAPQHPCACYLEAKQAGFNALAPASPSRQRRLYAAEREPRLAKGPAYEQVAREGANRNSATKSEWPTYRGNPARSGQASTSVPAGLQPVWTKTLGGKLTSPVIAGGQVYVASVDTHTVFALDAASGDVRWQFTADGRVDSPPTIHQDLVLFGSADGHVYCVRAGDGQLAWCFLAAPMDERLTAFEQVESVWPVHGSVLVLNGELYCVAGRSMFLDGGLRFWRLDPRTGKVLSESVLDDREQGTGKKLLDYVSWLNMPAAKPDILSSDGRYIFMRSQPFRLDGTRMPLKPMPRRADADAGAPPPTQDIELAHLFSPTGFLDDSWWHRTYWLYGSRYISGWCGYYLAGKVAPAGRLLVFDEDRVYGFGRKPKYYRWSTPIEHHLFAADKFVAPGDDQGTAPGQIPYRVTHHWTQDLPLLARAMVLADGMLFVAGPPDRIDEEQAMKTIESPQTQAALAEQAAAMDGEGGAILWAVTASEGQKRAEVSLDVCPVFDGMAAANGRLFMATLDGKIVCLGGR